jgi:hypothetical protein
MAGRACIGTSGWNYDSWRDDFYRGLPRSNWLRFCAERFSSIEVNATFYRLQSKETFRRWRDETPADFRFAIKGNRFVTHNKKLADPLPAIRLERDRAKGLGNKLAAVVWQLPERVHKTWSGCRVSRARSNAGAQRAMRSNSAMTPGSTRKSPNVCARIVWPYANRTPPTGRYGML